MYYTIAVYRYRRVVWEGTVTGMMENHVLLGDKNSPPSAQETKEGHANLPQNIHHGKPFARDTSITRNRSHVKNTRRETVGSTRHRKPFERENNRYGKP